MASTSAAADADNDRLAEIYERLAVRGSAWSGSSQSHTQCTGPI